MKVLVQRVTEASVTISENSHAKIEHGLLLLIGVERDDTSDTCRNMASKILAYRVFSDTDGKMNLNVQQVNGGILAISQFTLAADTKKGLRPGFSKAAEPAIAKALYEQLTEHLRRSDIRVETGIFAADMKVSLVNDGPVTFMLEM